MTLESLINLTTWYDISSIIEQCCIVLWLYIKMVFLYLSMRIFTIVRYIVQRNKTGFHLYFPIVRTHSSCSTSITIIEWWQNSTTAYTDQFDQLNVNNSNGNTAIFCWLLFHSTHICFHTYHWLLHDNYLSIIAWNMKIYKWEEKSFLFLSIFMVKSGSTYGNPNINNIETN